MGRSARNLTLPTVYKNSYGALLLDRPIFADLAEITDFANDLSGFFEILISLPDRIFDGNLRAYCRALGIDDRVAELLCFDEHDRPPLHGRADAYHDGTQFRLLEFNVGSELGGTDVAQLNRAYLDVPAFAGFAGQYGLTYLDTTARVARSLRTTAADITTREPVVALIEATGGLAGHQHVFLALREAMARHGIDLLLGEITELTERNGKIVLRGHEIDVILRYFVASELLDDTAGRAVLDLLVRADRAGRTALFTTLQAGVFASKNNLALVHDPQVRQSFSAAERDLVDRLVPWTRRLEPDLIERCLADQANLVLKPGIGYGGVGTQIGPDLSPEAWRQGVESGANGDHVIQQLVRSVPEPVVDPDTGAIEYWQANWGVFVDPEGYSGGFVRALRPRDGSIISYSNPGTRGTCIFTTAGDSIN